MDIAGIGAFAAALFIAAASPGPGIAALLARVLGRGPRGAFAFTFGLAFGDVIWLAFAMAGLAALAQTFAGVFLVVKYAGAAYLGYLAWRLWTAPVREQEIDADTRRESPVKLFLAGLAVTMGNPKVMVFYVALVPLIFDPTRLGLTGFVLASGVALAVLAIVFGIYIGLASRARRLFTSPRALRLINRGSGTVMAGAAITIATR
ncbi:MAG: LysE family translocator [Salinarimonas sp.]